MSLAMSLAQHRALVWELLSALERADAPATVADIAACGCLLKSYCSQLAVKRPRDALDALMTEDGDLFERVAEGDRPLYALTSLGARIVGTGDRDLFLAGAARAHADFECVACS